MVRICRVRAGTSTYSSRSRGVSTRRRASSGVTREMPLSPTNTGASLSRARPVGMKSLHVCLEGAMASMYGGDPAAFGNAASTYRAKSRA